MSLSFTISLFFLSFSLFSLSFSASLFTHASSVFPYLFSLITAPFLWCFPFFSLSFSCSLLSLSKSITFSYYCSSFFNSSLQSFNTFLNQRSFLFFIAFLWHSPVLSSISPYIAEALNFPSSSLLVNHYPSC